MRATLKGEYKIPNVESFPHEEGAWVLWSDHRTILDEKDETIRLLRLVVRDLNQSWWRRLFRRFDLAAELRPKGG
jgi:hypothetical protein